MKDTSALQRHYTYWDDYISQWFMCDMSRGAHLPEPWWGWSPLNSSALHSVVINLNPGKGGAPQTRDSLRTPILKNVQKLWNHDTQAGAGLPEKSILVQI